MCLLVHINYDSIYQNLTYPYFFKKLPIFKSYSIKDFYPQDINLKLTHSFMHSFIQVSSTLCLIVIPVVNNRNFSQVDFVIGERMTHDKKSTGSCAGILFGLIQQLTLSSRILIFSICPLCHLWYWLHSNWQPDDCSCCRLWLTHLTAILPHFFLSHKSPGLFRYQIPVYVNSSCM